MLYYAHNWIIDEESLVFVIHQLLSNPQKMDYDLKIDLPNGWRNDEGYSSVRFYLRARNNEVLRDFVENHSKEAGLTAWYQVTKDEFDQSFDLMAIDYVLLQNSYIDTLLEKGIKNTMRREELDQNQ